MPPAKRPTIVQGAQKAYFGIVRPNSKPDESREKELADLEGLCIDTLALAGTQFFDLKSASRRNTLAFYAALLFCRATKRRNYVCQMWTKFHSDLSEVLNDNEFIDKLAQHCSILIHKPVPRERIRERLRKSVARMRDVSAVRNDFVENVLALVEPIKRQLLQKPWTIWRAPRNLEFVTSDNPLVTFVRLNDGALHLGYGFRTKDVIAVFPLAPSTCLAMGEGGGSESVTLNEVDTMRINEAIIRMCDRYVYSKTFSGEIQSLVNERPLSRSTGRQLLCR